MEACKAAKLIHPLRILQEAGRAYGWSDIVYAAKLIHPLRILQVLHCLLELEAVRNAAKLIHPLRILQDFLPPIDSGYSLRRLQSSSIR